MRGGIQNVGGFRRAVISKEVSAAHGLPLHVLVDVYLHMHTYIFESVSLSFTHILLPKVKHLSASNTSSSPSHEETEVGDRLSPENTK